MEVIININMCECDIGSGENVWESENIVIKKIYIL